MVRDAIRGLVLGEGGGSDLVESEAYLRDGVHDSREKPAPEPGRSVSRAEHDVARIHWSRLREVALDELLGSVVGKHARNEHTPVVERQGDLKTIEEGEVLLKVLPWEHVILEEQRDVLGV